MYLYSATANGHQSSYALTQASRKLNGYENRYDRIFVENDTLIHSEMYVAVFTRMHPRAFQRAEKEIGQWKGWDNFRRLGKYHFPTAQELSALAVSPAEGRQADLFITQRPLPGARLLDSTTWNDDRYYIADNAPAGQSIR